MTLMRIKKWRLLLSGILCGGGLLLLNISGWSADVMIKFRNQNYNGNKDVIDYKNYKEAELANFKDLIAKYQNSSVISNETIQALLNITLQNKPNSQRSKQKPMQIIIATTRRSGSTLLSELLSSHPGVFNHFEPLYIFDEKRIHKGDNSSSEAVNYLATILKCGYTAEMFLHGRMKFYLPHSHNPQLLSFCNSKRENNIWCIQNDLFEVTCSLFPWHVMKLVTAGVDLLEPLFEDSRLNPHLIFFVRDPRAVINSRLFWHNFGSIMFSDPSVVCQYMDRDFDVTMKLRGKYSNRVHILRYEDLAQDPLKILQKLLKKMEWDFHPEIMSYIKSHMFREKDFNNPWSTLRDSAKRVTKWLTTMNETTIHSIQTSCYKVMSHLGYLPIISRNQLAELRSSNNIVVDSMNNSLLKLQPSIYKTLYRKLSY